VRKGHQAVFFPRRPLFSDRGEGALLLTFLSLFQADVKRKLAFLPAVLPLPPILAQKKKRSSSPPDPEPNPPFVSRVRCGEILEHESLSFYPAVRRFFCRSAGRREGCRSSSFSDLYSPSSPPPPLAEPRKAAASFFFRFRDLSYFRFQLAAGEGSVDLPSHSRALFFFTIHLPLESPQ